MIKISGVLFESQGFKLQIPTFEIPKEGVTCVWGPSGAGKSTLLQILAGIIDCSTLSVPWNNSAFRLGYVFQDYKIFPHMTVKENILAPVLAQNLSLEGHLNRYRQLIQQLNLEGIEDRKGGVLSGGESQRVALARAFAVQPSVVFMDEPFSALDGPNRDEARELVWELSRQYAVPFLVVTHDISDVRFLSRHLLFLEQGRLIAQGPTDGLLDHPPCLELARYLPDCQVLEGSRIHSLALKAPVGKTAVVHTRNMCLVKGGGTVSGKDFSISHIVDEGLYRLCYTHSPNCKGIKVISHLSKMEIERHSHEDFSIQVDPTQIMFV